MRRNNNRLSMEWSILKLPKTPNYFLWITVTFLGRMKRSPWQKICLWLSRACLRASCEVSCSCFSERALGPTFREENVAHRDLLLMLPHAVLKTLMQCSSSGEKDRVNRHWTTCLTTSIHRSALHRRAHHLVFNEEESLFTVVDTLCNPSSVWNMSNIGSTLSRANNDCQKLVIFPSALQDFQSLIKMSFEGLFLDRFWASQIMASVL